MAAGGVLRPNQGPKTKFSSTSEQNMAQYLDYCWEIGLPKTEERFSEELVHYMQYAGIQNSFPNVQPGEYYFF